MSYVILQNESATSRRQVYLWCVQSDGTSAATNEAGGQPLMSVGGLPMWATANTLSAVSAGAGLYRLTLGNEDSDVSILGQGTILYSSTTALPVTVNVEIVAYDPFAALATEAVLLPVAASFKYGDPLLGPTSIGTLSNQTTFFVDGASGDDDAYVGAVAVISDFTTPTSKSVAPIADYVGATGEIQLQYDPGIFSISTGDFVTIMTARSILNGSYSGVTVGVNNLDKAVGAVSGLSFAPVPGDYGSTVSVGVTAIKGGDYSDVTVRVAGNIALTSAVTLAAGRYSNVTIGGVEALESGVTVDTGGIIAASFGAAAIDAVALATDAGQEIADRLLQRNIHGGADSGRTVSEALATIRNRVQVDGSVVTVYKEDDTTAYWTASAATVSTNSGLLSDLNPS